MNSLPTLIELPLCWDSLQTSLSSLAIFYSSPISKGMENLSAYHLFHMIKRLSSRHNMNSAINVLKASVFKSRQQKNAITALGHFFTLVVQTVMFGTLASCHLFIHENSGVATW